MKVASSLALALALLAPADGLTVGGEVPETSFKAVDGRELKLSDLVKDGKIVVVVSWSLRCPTNAVARVDELAKKYREEGKVVIVGVSAYGDTPEKIQEYLKEKDPAYPVMHDADKSVSKRFAARKVNAAYVIVEGKLFYRGGAMRNGKDCLGEAIEAALGGKSAPPSDRDKLG